MKPVGYLVLLFLVIILVLTSFTANRKQQTNKVGDKDDILLTFSGIADEEYIKKIYFIGDSTTYHFYKGGIALSHILVPDSKTLKLTSDILSVKVGEDSLSIPDAVSQNRAELAILTIGVNGADSFTEKQYKTYYKKLILEIKEKSPDTRLIIQSVFPVTCWYSEMGLGISNEGIDRINSWGYELASELGINYLDTQSILRDESGGQMLLYSENDGVHINSLGYEKIIEYIASHAIALR